MAEQLPCSPLRRGVLAAALVVVSGQLAGAPLPKANPMTTSMTLSARQAEIPLIAAAMASSDMPRLRTALVRGLDAGLTVSETKEILVHLYAYAGFPRSLNALTELMKLVEERRQGGIHDAPGREPSRPVATGAALLEVGTANQTRISGAPVKGPVFDFAPAINQFLQAHLFGDLFERDNLDWQSRELATVGALAAVPGLEAQLRAHMNASLNVGLSVAQLRQVVQVLRSGGDSGAAERAGLALDALPPTGK
jgi:4-carboxymuconolactone decarboxylase